MGVEELVLMGLRGGDGMTWEVGLLLQLGAPIMFVSHRDAVVVLPLSGSQQRQ